MNRSLSVLRPAGASARDDWLLPGAVTFGWRDAARGVRAEALDDHLRRLGPMPRCDFGLLEALQYADARGRGGAAFPVATKWRSAIDAGGAVTVIANGAEGEPGSAKDAALLQTRPQLVLDGLEAAAQATGAGDVVIWLHAGAAETHAAVAAAVAQRRRQGGPQFRIRSGSEGYLTGESSAVIAGLSGQAALPRFSRRPSAAGGVDGRATVVHNVETLARVAMYARDGADAPETTLLTIVRGSHRTVIEVDAQTPLGSAAAIIGLRRPPQAVLVGGYGGTWLRWPDAAHIAVNDEALRAVGARLGAGVLCLLEQEACGLIETAAITRFLAVESARQCGPCLFGLPAVAAVIDRIAAGRPRRRDVQALHQYCDEIDGRGACHLPDGAVRLIRSALTCFEEDLDDHLRGTGDLHGYATPTFPGLARSGP